MHIVKNPASIFSWFKQKLSLCVGKKWRTLGQKPDCAEISGFNENKQYKRHSSQKCEALRISGLSA